MRGTRESTGSGSKKANIGRNQKNGIGRTRPGAAVRPASEGMGKEVETENRNIRIEIRWCPAHWGVAGNEKADEWAKQAAEEPDARGVEWMGYTDRYGK